MTCIQLDPQEGFHTEEGWEEDILAKPTRFPFLVPRRGFKQNSYIQTLFITRHRPPSRCLRSSLWAWLIALRTSVAVASRSGSRA